MRASGARLAEAVAALLASQRRPIDAAAFQCRFIDERPLLEEAAPEHRAHLQRQYLVCEPG